MGVVEVVLAVAVCGVVGVGLLLAALGVGFLVMRRRSASPAPSAPAPTTAGGGTIEAWAAGAYGLWTGAEDSGTWPQGQARAALRDWYGAEDREGFRAVIDDLFESAEVDNAAWDLARALDLLRIGTAAGYIPSDECWKRSRKAAKKLRKAYDSWDELALAFEEGMHEWQDEREVADDDPQRGLVQKNLPVLRATVWPRAAFDADV